MMDSARARTWKLLHTPAGQSLSWFNLLVCGLIVLASTLAVLETEASFAAEYEDAIFVLNVTFAVFFTGEYLLRVWAATCEPKYRGFGVIRYMLTPAALFDLAMLVPSLLLPGTGNAFLLRVVRLWAILRILRLGRFSDALDDMVWAIKSRGHELLIALASGFMLLILASTSLYLVEGHIQPEEFGSIPRAMWWGVITLTTVGYGDVYPITPLGKLIAGVVAVLGFGLIAMPAGILAGAFSHAVQRSRSEKEVGSGE